MNDNPNSHTAWFVAAFLGGLMAFGMCCLSESLHVESQLRADEEYDREQARLKRLIAPAPPVMEIGFTDWSETPTTSQADLVFEQLGQPRLHQFFDDRSLGWIVRLKVKAMDAETGIARVQGVTRDKCGKAESFDFTYFRAYVNCKGYDLQFAEWRDSDGECVVFAPNDESKQRQLLIRPEYELLDRGHDCASCAYVIVDLFFKVLM